MHTPSSLPVLATALLALLSPVDTGHANMQFVTVGNPGNPAQSASNRLHSQSANGDGRGSVPYEFEIGKYEVTIAQYTEFLNAKASSDPYGLYNPVSATDIYGRGILRSGSPGSYQYSVVMLGTISSGPHPVTSVSWFDAARFCNWMHNGQGAGSTETGAYNLYGATSGVFDAQPNAKYRLPTLDEWFKAAYFDPEKVNANGSVGGYWLYPTKSDIMSSNKLSVVGAANYIDGNQTKVENKLPTYLTPVGGFVNSRSYYGTYDQAGNVWEWLGNHVQTVYLLRGGAWSSSADLLGANGANSDPPDTENSSFGLRIVRDLRTSGINTPPVLPTSPITKPTAVEDVPYTGQTLAGSATDAEGDTITYSKVSGPSWLTVAANGVLGGTPTNGDVGPNTFTVRATDSKGLYAQTTLNITVTNTNDAPVFTVNPVTKPNATEDSPYTGQTLAGSASDVDAGDTDTLAYSKTGGPAWLSVAANGILSGTPANGDLGSNSFTVRVTDAAGAYAEATLAVTVINVNDLPYFTTPSRNGEPGTVGVVYSGTLAGWAVDVDPGATISYSKVSGSQWLTLAANGTLGGTPTTADIGPNSYTIRATDNTGAFAEATLYITIVSSNRAPVWGSNPVVGADATEDASYSSTLGGKATDPDPGDTATLAFSKINGPAWLSVAANGTLSGLPGNSNVGTNSFGVRVTDGAGFSADTTLQIAVANVNDAPVFAANPIAGSGGYNGIAYSATLAGRATDVDAGDTLTYSKASGPAWLVVAGDGNLSGMPEGGDVGTNTFTLRATDTAGAYAETALVIEVVSVNPPVFPTDPVVGAEAMEDTSYSGTLAGTATDIDPGDTLVYSKVSGPAWLTIAADGTLSGTPANDNVGIDEFTIRTTDSRNLYAQATLRITVANANDTPEFTANPIILNEATEDSPYSGTLAGSATDVDAGDTLTYAKVAGPDWLTVDADGTLSGTPGNDDVIPANFLVRVADAAGAFAEAVLKINVANVNDAPVFNASPITGTPAAKNKAYSSTLDGNASDVDAGDTLSYSKVSGPTWLTLAENGVLGGMPSNGDVGINQFTVRVTDAAGLSGEAELSIEVLNVNPPVFTANPMVGTDASEDSGYTGSLAGFVTDEDPGDTHTFFVLSGPNWLVVDADGTLSGTPSNADVGLNAFTIRVTDTTGLAAEATLNVTVGNTNDAPEFSVSPINRSADEDAPLSGTLADTASDVDAGDTLTYSKVSGPNWLSIDGTGALSGTPANADIGLNEFVVRVTDAAGTFAEAALEITVFNLNDAPVFTSAMIDKANATEDSPYAGTLAGSATDVDAGDTLRYSKVSGPAWLTVVENGTLAGTPANDAVGQNTFTVRAADAEGLFAEATLQITVVNVNDAPAFAQSVITGTQGAPDQPYSGSLATLASDVDAGDSITFSKVSGPTWLTVAANGTLGGTPSGTNVGLNSFTVRVTDAAGAFGEATLNISVQITGPAIWTNAIGGSWTIATNWQSNTIADGAGNVADFTTLNLLSSDRTVSLDGARTIGHLRFADTTPSHNWILAPGTGGPLTLAVATGSPSVEVVNQIATIGVPLAGSQGLTKTGQGTLELTATTNSLTGGLVISNGTVRLRNTGALSTSGAVNIASGATFQHSAGAMSMSGVISGSGGITKDNSGIFTLAANNTFSGPIAINNGSIAVSSPANLGTSSTITLSSSGSLRITAGSNTYPQNIVLPLTSANNVVLSSGSGASTFSGSLSGGQFTVTGSGTSLKLTGISTFTGNTTVPCSLEIGGAGQLGAGNYGGAISLASSKTFTHSSSANQILSGSISGGGVYLKKTGTGILTLAGANNTYSGTSEVSQGTLLVNGSLTSTFNTTTVSAGATLGGTGFLAGAVTNSGTLAPGSNAVGNLTINNTLTLAAGSKVAWEISNWTGAAGSGYDKLTTGSLNLTATSANPITIKPTAVALANFTETSKSFVLVQTTSGISGFAANKFVIDPSAITVAKGSWAVQQVGNNLVLNYVRANTPPAFTTNPVIGASATENTTYVSTLAGSATDADAGDTLTYAKVSGPEWLTVAADGTLGGTPANANVGLNTFTVSATDGTATATATLNITVTSANAAPVFTTDPIMGADATEDGAYSGTLAGTATDADAGDILTYAKVAGPEWLTVATDGTMGGTPLNANVGLNTFTVSATDGTATTTATLNITVTNTNDAPVFTTDPITGADVTEDAAYSGTLVSAATDADAGDTLTYAKVSGPEWLTIATDGTMGGTPLNANVGLNTFTVSATDGTATTSATLRIAVIDSDANSNGILDTWESAKFGNADPGANSADADPDGDGLSNLMEYALDTNPLVGNPSPLRHDFHTLPDGMHLRLTVPRKNPVATNLDYIVETSSTLTGWSTTETTIESDTATELIVRDTLTTASAPKRFIRLSVRVK